MFRAALMKTIPSRCLRTQLARSFALSLGLFTLANLAAETWFHRFDGNLWWIDLRFLPAAMSRAALVVSALVLLGLAVRPPRGLWQRVSAAVIAGLLAFVAVLNAAQLCTLL